MYFPSASDHYSLIQYLPKMLSLITTLRVTHCRLGMYLVNAKTGIRN